MSSQGLTGEMFLDALGDPNASFIIKAASALTTATAQVTLLNGAQAKNVYWLVGSSATIGVGSAMKGNIIALQTIPSLTTQPCWGERWYAMVLFHWARATSSPCRKLGEALDGSERRKSRKRRARNTAPGVSWRLPPANTTRHMGR